MKYSTDILLLCFFIILCIAWCNKPANIQTEGPPPPDTVKEIIYKTVTKTAKGEKAKIYNREFRRIDTVYIYRDSFIFISVSNLNDSNPVFTYNAALPETLTTITKTRYRYSTVSAGILASPYQVTPNLQFCRPTFTALAGYDLINKSPVIGLNVKISNFNRRQSRNR
jgi:hypothetical protein